MYSSILINVKDEHRYITEWVEHHLSLGFEHIYVVEDFNSTSHKDLLKPYIESGIISLHRMEDFGITDISKFRTPWRQVWMYNAFFRKGVTPHDDEWCMFLDTDEFLMFRDGYMLTDLLEDCMKSGRSFMYIPLRNFNADGRVFAPKGNTIDSYHHWEHFTRDMLCRSIVKADDPHVRFLCIQRAIDRGCAEKPSIQELETGNAWVNHYFTKSWEDWLVRMRRGSQDKNLRKLEQFFDIYNKGMLPYKDLLISEYRKYEDEWLHGGTRFISEDGIARLKELGYVIP